MLVQLNPPLPLETSKGPGWAHFVIDYGPESALLWVVFSGSGRCLLDGAESGNPHGFQLDDGTAQARRKDRRAERRERCQSRARRSGECEISSGRRQQGALSVRCLASPRRARASCERKKRAVVRLACSLERAIRSTPSHAAQLAALRLILLSAKLVSF